MKILSPRLAVLDTSGNIHLVGHEDKINYYSIYNGTAILKTKVIEVAASRQPLEDLVEQADAKCQPLDDIIRANEEAHKKLLQYRDAEFTKQILALKGTSK